MDNKWLKKYDAEVIEKELAVSTVEYLAGDGKIHKKVLTNADYRGMKFAVQNGSSGDFWIVIVKEG